MKKFRRTISSFLVFFAFLIFAPSVFANNIESINIEAIIQEDASVIIRDHRIFYADQGTEHYLSLDNLAYSELLDFTVYDENNQPLVDIGSWDVNASFEEKAGKYGVNESDQGLELCFGLGDYGRREFTIEYQLSNFVFNLQDDHQAFYWQFINPDIDPIDKIKIKVANSIDYIYEYPKTRFWGFGHLGGETEILEDSLDIRIDDNFSQSDYVVLLAIFEGTPFNAQTSHDWTSESLASQAMEETTTPIEEPMDDDLQDPNSLPDTARPTVLESAGLFFSFFLGPIVFFLAIFLLARSVGGSRLTKFAPTLKDQYYREIPYEGNFVDTSFLAPSQPEDAISAFILKWINEGRLRDDVEETGHVFKKERLSLHIIDSNRPIENPIERELWQMILNADDGDRILSQKEFNRYIKRHTSTFNNWTRSVKDKSKDKLLQTNYIETENKKILGLFNSKKLILTRSGQDLVDQIDGFKNYLKDFSLIEERGASQIHLWQEFMVWAAFLGMAEEVYKQFEIVDPNYTNQMPYNYHIILMTNNFASQAISTQSSANSASSGFGGGSFGGGGGGSFGGGSGGGTR